MMDFLRERSIWGKDGKESFSRCPGQADLSGGAIHYTTGVRELFPSRAKQHRLNPGLSKGVACLSGYI